MACPFYCKGVFQVINPALINPQGYMLCQALQSQLSRHIPHSSRKASLALHQLQCRHRHSSHTTSGSMAEVSAAKKRKAQQVDTSKAACLRPGDEELGAAGSSVHHEVGTVFKVRGDVCGCVVRCVMSYLGHT